MLSSFQFAVVVGLGVDLFSAPLSAQSTDLRPPLPVLNQDGRSRRGRKVRRFFSIRTPATSSQPTDRAQPNRVAWKTRSAF